MAAERACRSPQSWLWRGCYLSATGFERCRGIGFTVDEAFLRRKARASAEPLRAISRLPIRARAVVRP